MSAAACPERSHSLLMRSAPAPHYVANRLKAEVPVRSKEVKPAALTRIANAGGLVR